LYQTFNQGHQWFPGGHSVARICRAFGVEHRLTKPAHPWTNGQVERMNRTIKEATVQRFHYQTTDELNEHLQAFLLAYNHAKCLKTLRGLTPHEFVCAQWQKNPAIFTQDPTHLTLGLYILEVRTITFAVMGLEGDESSEAAW
jgi:Integrase core domain